MNIRPAGLADAPQIVEIYNHYIKTSDSTFEVDPIDADAMARRMAEVIDGGYPFLVAEINNELVGYASGHQYEVRAAYRHSVEVALCQAGEHGTRNRAGIV